MRGDEGQPVSNIGTMEEISTNDSTIKKESAESCRQRRRQKNENG